MAASAHKSNRAPRALAAVVAHEARTAPDPPLVCCHAIHRSESVLSVTFVCALQIDQGKRVKHAQKKGGGHQNAGFQRESARPRIAVSGPGVHRLCWGSSVPPRQSFQPQGRRRRCGRVSAAFLLFLGWGEGRENSSAAHTDQNNTKAPEGAPSQQGGGGWEMGVVVESGWSGVGGNAHRRAQRGGKRRQGAGVRARARRM